jgi:tetratricopeptide (TPR) repeat protein
MASMSLQAACDQARQWIESNDFDRAIGLAQHILEQYPQNLEAYRILGEAYLASRQLDLAQGAFERVLRSDPENIPAHVGLGITYERLNKLDRAVAEFEQALEVKPDMPELRNQLLRLYTEAWGSEYAQLRLSRAGLARLYARGHMLPQAIAEFRHVIADQPDRYDARAALAEALWRNEQEDDAIALCRELLRDRPELLKANLILGYLEMAAGRPEGEQYWEAAQEIDPYQSVARAMFDPLPPARSAEPMVEEWDETAWRRRLEEQEQLAATRPMETPTANVAAEAEAPLRFAPPLAATAAPAAADTDDFLASLLAFDSPPLATPAEEPVADVEIDADMQPFSLADLTGEAPAAPAETPAEPEMTPFSLSDLGLSPDEIAALEQGELPETPEAAEPEPETTPFTLSELGLSDDEIAALEQGEAPADAIEATEAPAADHDRPTLTPFSLSDLGLSPDEIAALESLNSAEEAPAIEATPTTENETVAEEEPTFTPFSLSELGLSDDEIAALEQGQIPAETEPAAPAPAAEEEEPTLTPFSLSELGLSDDEIAALEQGQAPTDAGEEEPDVQPFSLSDLGLGEEEEATVEHIAGVTGLPSEDALDLDTLPADLQPFSFAELDTTETTAEAGELPSSLQPFSLEDTPAGPTRPRLTGLAPEEAEAIEAQDEGSDEPVSVPRGFSWQQPTQRAETGFARSLRDEPAAEDSETTIFNKLKQQRESGSFPIPEPLPPVPIAEDEHMGLFSLDDVSLRHDGDELTIEQVAAGMAQEAETQPPTAPETGAADEPPAPVEEVESIEAGLAAGAIAPFSLADLGLSDDEIAALGLSPTPGELPEPAAETVEAAAEESPASSPEMTTAEPPAPIEEVESIEAGLAAGAIAPFSLADLGLSDDEIAALGLSPASADITEAETSAASELETTAAPAAEETETPVEEVESIEAGLAAGAIAPFSLADLGLSDDEIAALDLEPESVAPPAAAAAEAPTTAAAEEIDLPLAEEIQPFSLADLGLSDDEIADLNIEESYLDEQDDSRLGLTEDELAGLDVGGDVDWSKVSQPVLPAAEPVAAEAPASGELEDAAVTRLMELGERQGFVDIADIIAAVEDPEAEAARIEMIGQMLHEARIEIRDGDEVVDMDAEYAEEEAEYTEAEESLELPTAPAAASDEPELTPFSLSELGLSDDEIASLGLGDQAGASASEPPASDTGKMTSFSLDELGLPDEALASLGEGSVPRTPEPPVRPSSSAGIESVPLTDLGLTPEEIGISLPAAAPAPTPPPTPTAPSGSAERAPTAPEPITSTGNEVLDEYLQLIDADPQDFTLRLAVARVGVQAGLPELAVQQYKEMIKRGALLDDIAADIIDVTADIDDTTTRRRLYRVLGDVYTKQGRIRDAVQAYGWSGGTRS